MAAGWPAPTTTQPPYTGATFWGVPTPGDIGASGERAGLLRSAIVGLYSEDWQADG